MKRVGKKIRGIVLLLTMALVMGCAQNTGNTDEKKEDKQEEVETEKEQVEAVVEGEKHHIEINVKEYGVISVELDTTYAPVSVENFMKLAKEGFYDGLTFHRIIEGFMIQGGDPKGDGTGGSETTIKGEFKENGVENQASHTRGAIAMARSQNMDSASSQFFIVHQDSTYLDGQYAVFGYVTQGIEIVDKICQGVEVEDANGAVKPEKQPMIESIKVLD